MIRVGYHGYIAILWHTSNVVTHCVRIYCSLTQTPNLIPRPLQHLSFAVCDAVQTLYCNWQMVQRLEHKARKLQCCNTFWELLAWRSECEDKLGDLLEESNFTCSYLHLTVRVEVWRLGMRLHTHLSPSPSSLSEAMFFSSSSLPSKGLCRGQRSECKGYN